MKQPQPFFRKFTQSWYVQLGGKQIALGKDEGEAFAKYRQIVGSPSGLDSHVTTVHELLDDYLEWVQQHRAAATYESTRFYLSAFAKTVGSQLKIAEVRPFHVTAWMACHKTWGDTSQHDAISILQRAFSWAVKRRMLDEHPLRDIEEKPAKQRREFVLTPEQWKLVTDHVGDARFVDLLTFLWETGCRPLEARQLEAGYCDLGNSLAVYPLQQSKGKRRRRVLFLNATAVEICRRLAEKHPTGPIFRNRLGNAWTKDAMQCRLSRLRDKLAMPELCAYTFRHSFATQGLMNGVDPVTLGHLMGHVDGTMVARQYQHLAANLDYLKNAAERVKGRGA
ncbi:tyrosine-type recombinase/integrase [Botrimarina mediterranea]|uniref:Site-specific tyrosine recombinase XerC n=1 Tax=Botrimarina mediterranea TaxID=2528022 RepID=A0A518KCN4_9BACT|nr:tyrosine-type recombinase/integrase [Botrimarina mediterranea]QDV75562.1 site-specific tyrosine recombinase XerC [Botrimarina mediterranea]QDV80196.1 site-specific tyrosine recombinase XerC [Planctomycetes bacterium K2D]